MQASDFLKKMGLHEHEVRLYLLGLSLGTQATSIFAKKLSLPRSTTQLYLLNLTKFGYMSKTVRAGVQFFTSLPPDHLENIITKRKDELQKREMELREVLPELSARKSELSQVPDVTYYDGEDGVKAIYRDLLEQKVDLLLFQSPLDHYTASFSKFLEKHIRKQVQEGIHVKALTPKVPDFSVNFLMQYDKISNVERCFTLQDEMNIPSQMLVYGDRVAIISGHTERMRGILIKDKDYATTMEILFKFIWSASKKIHNKIVMNDDPLNYAEDVREMNIKNNENVAEYITDIFHMNGAREKK